MINKKTKNYRWLMVVVIIGLFALITIPTTAMAYDCGDAAGDSDGDGLSDAVECIGVMLDCDWNPATASTFDKFPGLYSGLARSERLDPASPDLFVALIVTTPPSGYGRTYSPLTEILLDPAVDPLALVNKPVAEGGLGLAAHRIPAGICVGADRIVTETPSIQKAAYISENMTAGGNFLGEAQYGTPNGPDDAIIYTQNIIDHIDDVCQSAFSCQDSSGAAYNSGTAGFISDSSSNLDGLKVLHVQNTLAHELGHMVSLRVGVYVPELGGHHYAAGSNYVLDEYVTYDSVKSKGKKYVTFHITSDYHPDSMANKIIH